MRSVSITFMLAVAALIGVVAACWSLQRGNFHEVFGAPPSAVGELIYPDFDVGEVAQIRISRDGHSVLLTRRAEGWRVASPWDDRADSRAVMSILQFTRALRVEDFAEVDETDRQATGMRDGVVRIRMEDAEGKRLVDYKLGRKTPWAATLDVETATGVQSEAIPSLFVETRDRGRRAHVYIVGGDISPLFRDDLRFLRDHRPFYFNPAGLAMIGISTDEGELTLQRESPESPWRIAKPLEVGTHAAAVKALIEGLFDLSAVKIEDASRTVVATNARKIRISLAHFGIDQGDSVSTTLEVRMPDGVEDRFAYGMVSDRPGVAFHIPIKPEAELVTLADLPLGVNSLRDVALTHLNIASIATLMIRPATGPEIHVFRDAGRPWMTRVVMAGEEVGSAFPANELRLFELLNAITRTRVVAFESDAAVDLAPWGLDRPVLTLAFLGRDHQLLEIDFGLDGRGGVYSMRKGSNTVTKLEDDFLKSIAVQPFEWQQARVWSLSKVDLQKMIRMRSGKPVEKLDYRWKDDEWRAERDDEDASPELIPERANFIFERLEGIESDRWLPEGDPSALAALAKPLMRFAVFEHEIDEFGDPVDIKMRNMGFAAAPEFPGSFYGLLIGNPNPFLISDETFRSLAIPIFDDE